MASGTWDNGDLGSGTWELDESTGTITVSGTGMMPDYTTASDTSWNSYKSSIKHVVITNGITHVGNCNFKEFTKLLTVDIGDSVESIGNSDGASSGQSFSYCTSLTQITLGHNVNYIAQQTFYNCREVEEIYFKGSAPTMGAYVMTFGSTSIYKYDNFCLATSQTYANTSNVYTTGWGSDDIFTSGNSSVRGNFTTFNYLTWTPPEPEPESKSPEIPVNVSGTWKASTPYVNVGGTWKEVTNVYVNVNGTWKEVV